MSGRWTVLSNHGLALVCVARDPGIRLRDLADCMGVSDRTAFGVVDELIESGYLRRYKEGNRNRYEIDPEAPMRHPIIEDHWVGELLAVFVPESLRGQGRAGGDYQGPTGRRPIRPPCATPRAESGLADGAVERKPMGRPQR